LGATPFGVSSESGAAGVWQGARRCWLERVKPDMSLGQRSLNL